MTEQPESQEAADFFQRRTFNARERLVCSHLIECVNSIPLDVVLHTTQAALLLDPETMNQLEIDKEQVTGIYTVAHRLANPSKKVDHKGTFTYHLSLRSLNHEKHVLPWFQKHIMTRATEPEHQNFVENREEWSIEKNVSWITGHLSESGYYSLMSDFLFWATPIIQEIGGKLTTIISPETYVTLFKLMRGEMPSR